MDVILKAWIRQEGILKGPWNHISKNATGIGYFYSVLMVITFSCQYKWRDELFEGGKLERIAHSAALRFTQAYIECYLLVLW